MRDDILSLRGSYLYVNNWQHGFNIMNASETFKSDYSGLYISSLHGKTKSTKRGCAVTKIDFLKGDQILSCDYHFDYEKLTISYANGKTEVGFGDDKTILIAGNGSSLQLDNIPVNKFDYIQKITKDNEDFYIITNYTSKVRLLIYALKGRIEFIQNYYGDEYAGFMGDLISKLIIHEDNGELYVVVKEIPHNMIPLEKTPYDFDECISSNLNDFKSYCSRFPKLEPYWQKNVEDVLYTLWGNEVKPYGDLKRRNIVTSPFYNAFWSYDYGYVMRAIYKADLELALDLARIFFDEQDEFGCVPGTITDNEIRWNYLKPPAFGYFGLEMIEENELSREENVYFYEHLKKQVSFYLNYRDCNKDGICEYHHGNESGLDNMSVFDEQKVIDTVDLSLLMIGNYKVLAILSDRIGNEEGDFWRKEAVSLSRKAAEYFIKDHMPISRYPQTGEIYESKSILPYFVLNLGKELSEETVNQIVKVLKEEFITPYGIATESVKSKEYSETSWFRGFTFYQPTNVIDGLAKCGYLDLAKELSRIYCDLIRKNGTRDGFSTIDGRPILYSTMSPVAASYLYLCNKYLNG